MARSKKKAGAAQIPSTTRQQGRRQPESDIAARQLSKESREETLTKPEEEDLQGGGGGGEKEKGLPEVEVGEEEKGIPVVEVEEEEKGIPVVEVEEEEKGLPEVVGEEEKGIPIAEVEEEEKGLQEEEKEEEEAEQDNDKVSLNMEEKTPNVPKKPVATGGNILFVGNLPDSISQANLKDFFKDVGAVTGVQLAKLHNGSFRGFAYVEFATEAAAKKALERNGQRLCGRNVVLNIAQKHGPGLDEQGRNCTAFVRGFGKKQEKDEIKNILTTHFGSCGGIVEVRIPKDEKRNCLKGFAYIQFVDHGAVMKAVELNGSELDSCTLFVEKAKTVAHGRSGGGRSGKRKRNPNVP